MQTLQACVKMSIISVRTEYLRTTGRKHTYKITSEGLAAIIDYIEKERRQDHKRWRSPALFLSPATTPHGIGRLSPKVINTVWNKA